VRLSVLAFPLILLLSCEISIFIVIGREIGVLATIGLTFVTAVLGSFLLRLQGLSLVSQISREIENGHMPSRQLAHGAMVLLAGVLLMIPGFLSDMLGLLLFIPPIRDFAWSMLSSRLIASRRTHTWRGSKHPDLSRTIELPESEYERRPKPEIRG
jgi:UPF0716 protein FxsA